MKDRLQFYHFMIGICLQCKFFNFVYHDTCFASRPSRECLTVEGGNQAENLFFSAIKDFLNEGTLIELCNLKCLQHQCWGFFSSRRAENLKFYHVIGVPAGENHLLQRKFIIFDILLVR